MPVPAITTFAPATTIQSSVVNANFEALRATLDHAVDATNLASAIGDIETRLATAGNVLGAICEVSFTATGRPILLAMNSSGSSTAESILTLRRTTPGPTTNLATLGRISSTHQHDSGVWIVFGLAAGAAVFDILISGGSLAADTTLAAVEL